MGQLLIFGTLTANAELLTHLGRTTTLVTANLKVKNLGEGVTATGCFV
jgi:hypothetical protein